MKAIIFLAGLIPLSTLAQIKQSITFTNQYGPHINVEVVRVTETTVVWRDTNSGNGGSVKLADLPESLRLRLGFDPVKASQIEQKTKQQQEALQKQQATLEAEASKLSHWDNLSVLSMEFSKWSRYKCLVRSDQEGTRTILIANVPSDATSLPAQIRDAEAKAVTLDQQIRTVQIAIAQGESQKQAAWNRYVYTSDDYSSTTTRSRGASSVDTAETRRAAPYVIQAQIEQAQQQLSALQMQREANLATQNELKRRLSAIRIRAFFTGHYFDGLQIWDCAPR